jgi:hypothetical protein
MAPMDDIPDTGVGIVPPSAEHVPGRLLANEIRAYHNSKALQRLDSRLERLFWMILAGSFGVMITVIGAAIYVGGRFQAIENLDRRVTRLEDGR